MAYKPATAYPAPPSGPIGPEYVIGYDPIFGDTPDDPRYTLRVFVRREIEFSTPRPWVLVMDGGGWGPTTGLPAAVLEDVIDSDEATNLLVRKLWERGVAVVSMGYTVRDEEIGGEGAFDPATFGRTGTPPSSILYLDPAQQATRCAERDVCHAIQLIRNTGLELDLDTDDDRGGFIGLSAGVMSGAFAALGFNRGDPASEFESRDAEKTRVGFFVGSYPLFSWNAWTDAKTLQHLTDGAGGTAATVGDAKAVEDGPDNQNIRDASPLWYGFNAPSIRSRNASLPVYFVGYGTATYAGPFDYDSFSNVVSDTHPVEMVDAIETALLAVEAEYAGVIDPIHSTTSVFEKNPSSTPAELAEAQYQWCLDRFGLEELAATTEAHYVPDFPAESYAPPSVIPTPWEFLTVFLPDANRFPRPDGGYPALIANGFGGWASSLPSLEIADAPSLTVRILWQALEAGFAVITFGVPGTDSTEFAPGGAYWNNGLGVANKGNVVLGTPLLGLATFDPPGSTVENYDHWDDVGSSVDGGYSYPHDDFRFFGKCAVWAVQYIRSRAAAWGIDSRLLALEGRSAGAWATSFPALGPDRADPAMQDHRSESSRVPLYIPIAGSFWAPAWVSSMAGLRIFPSTTSASKVAPDLTFAPDGYLEAGSALEFGFRSYQNEGPGVSGQELRAQNGRLAVFIANLSQALGTTSATPTEALAFSGTDAEDNRRPSISNDLSASEIHPGIMGPLLFSRLREVDSGGFQDANSRLVVSQAAYDFVAGHTTASGDSIQAIVSHVEEDIWDADETISPTVVSWLGEQFDRIRVEEGIDQDPAPTTPIHERRSIRDALAARLTGATAAGSRVFASRARPYGVGELPALGVFTDDETWEIATEAPREYDVAADVRVVVVVRGTDATWEPTLDALCREVEQIVEADETLGGVANRITLARTEVEFDHEGAAVIAKRSLVFSVSYLVSAPRSDGSDGLDDFVSLQGPITTPDGSTVETFTTPEQL